MLTLFWRPSSARLTLPRAMAAIAPLIVPLLFALSTMPAWAATPEPQASEVETWPLLPERFESTGGGGWMIDHYRPVVRGAACVTDFVAVSPDGAQRFANTAAFIAKPLGGGVLCTQGRWRALDGSAEGTTPLVVYIKDGVVRRAP